MNIQANLKKIKRREIILVIIGLLLLIAIIGFVGYSLSFLVAKAEIALGDDLFNKENELRINFDGLKKIGIMK